MSAENTMVEGERNHAKSMGTPKKCVDCGKREVMYSGRICRSCSSSKACVEKQKALDTMKEHEFVSEKSNCEGTEYIIIFCKKCGIVSYDQRYKSKSYESNYKPETCTLNL